MNFIIDLDKLEIPVIIPEFIIISDKELHSKLAIMYNMSQHQYADNFKIIEKIGRGGFASVYKVANNFDDNFYALKKIKIAVKETSNVHDEIAKVVKEAVTLSALNHPNIVRYYGSWTDVKTSTRNFDSRSPNK